MKLRDPLGEQRGIRLTLGVLAVVYGWMAWSGAALMFIVFGVCVGCLVWSLFPEFYGENGKQLREPANKVAAVVSWQGGYPSSAQLDERWGPRLVSVVVLAYFLYMTSITVGGVSQLFFPDIACVFLSGLAWVDTWRGFYEVRER